MQGTATEPFFKLHQNASVFRQNNALAALLVTLSLPVRGPARGCYVEAVSSVWVTRKPSLMARAGGQVEEAAGIIKPRSTNPFHIPWHCLGLAQTQPPGRLGLSVS